MELWKFGGNEVKMHILDLFSKIIDKNQMPQEWETGMVINIHKKGEKANVKIREELLYCLQPTNYLQTIKNRLNEHLEDEMVEEQYGFRKGHSCTNAILTV